MKFVRSRLALPNPEMRAIAFTAACAGLFAAAGCAGTSPQLAVPTLNAPSPAAAAPAAAVAGEARAAAEAKLAPLEAVKTPEGTFFALPYLQIGAKADVSEKGDTLALLWQTGAKDAGSWTVEMRPAGGEWKKVGGDKLTVRHVRAEGVPAHDIWSLPLSGLAPGALFDYRLIIGGAPVFAARARARRDESDPVSRFVLFGDSGDGTPSQNKIAYQASLAKPDFVFLTGDIVSGHGEASEYRKNFFPTYNAESASPEVGAPLMRSTLFAAAPGRRDIEYRDLAKYPDALAYYDYWDFPANGPDLKSDDSNTPKLIGPEAAQAAFVTGASGAYPRAANYSFDYGSAHWTVLDSSASVDWTELALRLWLEKDLKRAKGATWRFVAFSSPPFDSSAKDSDGQQMRVLCDIFEKFHVDVVWCGHASNYQRTYPLKFAAEKNADGKSRDSKGRVAGKWTLDTAFDGDKKAKPDGVLYIVSGGGGADLTEPDMQQKPSEWEPFTAKYIASTHSFTIADIAGSTLTVRQVSEDGKDLDKFTLSKAQPEPSPKP